MYVNEHNLAHDDSNDSGSDVDEEEAKVMK